MDSAAFLGLVGSVASVGAIPLSIWLYLRSQEEKLASTRREILRILSYQLGEGRPLTSFEIQAVIDSYSRLRKLKPGIVAPNEVVDDLVAETIANPMLAPDRKQTILYELETALLSPSVRQIIMHYSLRAQDLAGLLDRQKLLRAADRLLLEGDIAVGEVDLARVADPVDEVQTGAKVSSSVFGFIVTFLTFAALAAEFSLAAPFFSRFLDRLPGREFLLSIGASIVAVLLTVFVERFRSMRASHRKRRVSHDSVDRDGKGGG